MDNEVPHQAPLSPIHLDRFEHQGPPVIDPSLNAEDIARLFVLVDFLSENAYNIKKKTGCGIPTFNRLDVISTGH